MTHERFPLGWIVHAVVAVSTTIRVIRASVVEVHHTTTRAACIGRTAVANIAHVGCDSDIGCCGTQRSTTFRNGGGNADGTQSANSGAIR